MTRVLGCVLGLYGSVILEQNVAENGDTFFWNALAESRSFSTEAAFPGSIARPQALLLLLTECIYGEDTGAFFAASRVFLCLCQVSALDFLTYNVP